MSLMAIEMIDMSHALDTLLSLSLAFVLGSLIGFERQYRQRTAGLRTNTLVAVGAAIFVDMASRLYDIDGASRIVAYVVSGVGFLGAGVIMRDGGSVRGINTAATLWGSAAIGACAGADLIIEALMGTAFVLAANTTLRPLVNLIDRQPLSSKSSELSYEFFIICAREQQHLARELLKKTLHKASLPIQEMMLIPYGERETEIRARILPASIDGAELDQIVIKLNQSSFVSQAFWTIHTED